MSRPHKTTYVSARITLPPEHPEATHMLKLYPPPHRTALCNHYLGPVKSHRRGATTTKPSRVTCAECRAALVDERLLG